MVTAEQIIEYVLYTPCNPNRSVLKGLLYSYLKDNADVPIFEDKVIYIPAINGTNTFEPANPNPGDTVTITTEPKEGYVVSDVIIVDIEGNILPLTDNGDGTYSYVQPENGIAVIPVIDYDKEGISPEDIIVYDGGGAADWV